ncbi:MAG: response regulator [Elusimicrobia bacterium]|nr:response regulator [Candidatus Liberimonas magnetica]
MFKIMIVDDEKDVVELLNFVLKNENYELHSAFSGKDVLEKLGILPSSQTVIKPDLIILDVMMPDIDGYTVVTRMLDNEKTRNIPIVVLSAKGQMRDLFEMSSNVLAFIDKPFDPEVLKNKINNLIDDIVPGKA